MTDVRSTFLRAVIAADAAACGAGGAGLAFAAPVLAGPLGLSPAFTQPVGLFLLGYAALLAVMAARPALPRKAVWGLVAFNLVWAVESVGVIVLGWVEPTALGVVLIVGQAAAAAVVADLQYLILRRARRAALATV
ncbi:hypothetical protein [Phenylobacterium sp. SCN 70-31]|uniref:hypothetical protein n=1 Tax=Phenylobacterium sp. SCN 70-31 TaxID=1660129 RepID=UPI00086C7E03|nr:hypothetical protein [Phenylobacterium sp. SCN 70-31]ODT88875.1 MAG: hypothetical protein ABS78_04500 [Phenylobacterium sp. SCN 70-31]